MSIRKVSRDKARTVKCSGCLYTGEIYAEPGDFYEELAKVGGDVGREARHQIRLLRRFPPGVPHDREISHVFEVFDETTRRDASSLGKSRTSINIGELVRKACEDEIGYRKIIKDNVTIYQDDGTAIEGIKIRKSPYLGMYGERSIPNPYLYITFDSTRWETDGGYTYDCYVRTDINWRSLLFRVTEVFSIDGCPTIEIQKELTPVFDERPLRLSMNHIGYFEHI